MRWSIPSALLCGFVPSVLVLGAGCISEEDFNRVVAERDAAYARAQTCETELDVVKGKVKELERRAAKSDGMASRPPAAKINAARTQLRLAGDTVVKAKIVTSKGPIVCELFPDIAPETVLNFVGLAEGTKEWTEPTTGQPTVEPLYEGTIFHRVIDGFMIQGGDPLGTGRGGPGYRFGDEIWPDVRFDKPGRLAMANSGPNTNGSQFFITSAPAPHINRRYTIFGQCEIDVVKEIMKVEVAGSKPKKDVEIEKIEILRESQATAAPVGDQGPSPSVPEPDEVGPSPEGEGPEAPSAE